MQWFRIRFLLGIASLLTLCMFSCDSYVPREVNLAAQMYLYQTAGLPYYQRPEDDSLSALENLLLESDRMAGANFQKNGDEYAHYDYPEPSGSCLSEGEFCFSDYIRYQYNMAKKSLSTKSKINFSPDIFIEPENLESKWSEKFVKDLTSLQNLKWNIFSADQTVSRATALEKIWLIEAGNEADKRLLQNFQNFINKAGINIQYAIVKPGTLFPEYLNMRISATAIYKGIVRKSLFQENQFYDLFEMKNSLPLRIEKTIVDAHIHLLENGEAKLLEILGNNHVAKAFIMPLPENINYKGLEKANRYVLRVAAKHKGKLIPFVMISPHSANPANDLKRHLHAGARGVKLLSGHNDYYTQSGKQPLDTPAIRRMLKVCEKYNIPVIWHVNDHLYREGFLRVLKDYPQVRFLNPHFAGYLTYAPGILSDLLNTYPNLYIDVSFGGDPAYIRRSLEDVSFKNLTWRRLFNKHPDRFIFGSDLVVAHDMARSHADMIYKLFRDFLEQDQFNFEFFQSTGYASLFEISHQRRGLAGLALTPNLSTQVFSENARNFLGDF